MPAADPAHYVRGQYDGYREIPGVAPDSTTETYAAMRLEIDNWRWSGVPFFLRTGKLLPVTQTELRLVFRRPPRLGFHAGVAHARAGPADRQARPHDRRPASLLEAQRGEPAGARADPPRHGVRRRGRRGPGAVRGAAARGDAGRQHALHPPGRRRGGVARDGSRCSTAPPPVHPYAEGTWGPPAGGPARRRTTGAGTSRGWRHEPLRRHRDRQRRGRRHARPPARAVGQADPAARAGRLAAARAAELAGAGRLRRQPLRLGGHLVRRATTGPSSRRCTTAWAARPSSTAPRCTACAPRTSASCATTTASRPAWPIGYDEMEPYYTRAEQLYQVHGARGEDPTEPPASAPYPFPAVSHEPRIQQLSDDLAAAGHHPFHAPCGVMLARARHAAQPLRPLRARATGSRASCTRSPTPRCSAVRPGARAPERDAVTNAEAVRLETSADGARGHRRRGRARRASARRSPATSSSSPAARPTAPGSCSPRRATRIRPASPTARTRSGATTCSTTARRCWRCRRTRTRRCSRRRSGSTTSTSAATTSSSRSATSRWSASRRRRCTAARSRSQTRLAPQRTLERVARHAVDFWLSTEDLPRPGEPRHAARRRRDPARATRRTTRSRSSGCCTSSSRCSGTLGMQQHHLMPRHAYLKNEIPVAGCAHQAGTCRFGTDPATSVLEHRLPRARGRQPLRRRHELLPEHRRGEPGADRDGQRPARRRPPARAPGRPASAREPQHVA